MHYFWTECPGCGCEVAVNWVPMGPGVAGSLRRWNSQRVVNDGRPFEIAAPAAGPFETPCVCGRVLWVTSQAKGGEREKDLRVVLG